MKQTYRNVAIAASGALVAAVAANMLRNRSGAGRMMAQTMTVMLDREAIADALAEEQIFRRAMDCDTVNVRRFAEQHIFEWNCGSHADRHSARLALIQAPNGRGTELHMAMHAKKDAVKEIVRRFKYLLEAGEIPTGARNL